MLESNVVLWLGFGAFVVTMMILDLGVFHRKARAASLREAAIWTVVWVLMAFAFSAVIYWSRGRAATVEFITGYLIEWSLSMDNVFVFAVIFSYFAVPPQYQHRVLFWGILGAVVMRLTFILVGAALLERYHWLIYPMGVFLVLTGIKLFFKQESDTDLSKNWVVRIARFVLPMTNEYVGQRFFVRVESLPVLATPVLDETAPDANAPPAKPIRVSHGLFGWHATPLLLVLLVVETTDVAFAVDSIPAIFGVTQDPFIVFTSNVFAILGLRALYFLLAGAMQLFRYLNVGLALILCFVGTKMLISHWIEIPIALSLAVVAAILAISIGVSLIVARAELRRVLVSPDVDEKYDGLHEGMST